MIKSIQNISFGGMVANALLHKILRRKGKVKKEVKLLLAALAVTLGVGWMSQPVLAEESADTGSGAASSGSCGVEGVDLTWAFIGSADEGYTLIISGSGDMQDYDAESNRAPWYSYAEENNILQAELTLGEGITHIGERAFQASYKTVDTTQIYSLQFTGGLEIPETVESIGAYAFAWNSFTGDLRIPDGVTSIGNDAFCSPQHSIMFNSAAIVIGYGLKEAGEDVFSGYRDTSITSTLYNLSEVQFVYNTLLPWPADGNVISVTRHYEAAVTAETTRRMLPDGIRGDLTGYHSFPNAADVIDSGDGSSIEFDWYGDEALSNPIQSIGSFSADIAVYGRRKGYTGVDYGIVKDTGTSGETTWTVYDSYDADELPDTLVISGVGAMADYEQETDRPWSQYKSSLRHLFLEEGVTYIGKNAFYGYYGGTSETKYYFEGELNIPSTVTGIGEKAFYYNYFSGTLKLPEKLTAVGNGAFAFNKFTGGLILPPGLDTVSESAFEGGSWDGQNQFSYIVVPESVQTIGDSAFPSGKYQYYNLSEQTFKTRYMNDRDPVPNDGMLYISRHYDDLAKTMVKRKILPDGVADASDCAYAASYAQYHSFPNELDEKFGRREGYEDIQITWYSDADCTSPVSSVESFTGNVDYYAKSNHAGEIYIEPSASGSCGAQGENVKWYLIRSGEDTNGNDAYILVLQGTGEMQDYEKYQTPWDSKRAEIRNVILSSGITRIGKYAFWGLSSNYSNLTVSVTFPDTLKSIGSYAFADCTAMDGTSLFLPEGLETVEAHAFDGAFDNYYAQSSSSKLVLILPDSLTEIGEKAFYCWPAYATVFIGNRVGKLTLNELPQRTNTIYNFSQNEISSAVELPSFTKRIVSPDGKSYKEFERRILAEDDLPVASYPEAVYPQLVKYRSFPTELDWLDGKELTWYSDESRQSQVTGIPESGTTVYALCPGHVDQDGDGKCDYCNQGRTLTISGATTAEIAFADSYTVPENLYLVDSEGNRVTTMTESMALTALVAIKSVDLTLTDSIAMNYRVAVAKNHELTKDGVPVMTFQIGGRTYQAEAAESSESGEAIEYSYSLKELLPQQMSEKVNATVSLGEISATKKDYSVQIYCESMLKKDSEALGISTYKLTALRTLLVDMLYYGDAAQEYIGQTAVTTAGLTEEQKAWRSSDTTGSASNNRGVSGTASEDYKWQSARLQLRDRVAVVLSFYAKETENLVVRATVNGQEKEYTNFHENGNGSYSVVLEGVMPTQYETAVSAQLYQGESPIGQKVTYSVGTYVYKMKNEEGLKDMLRGIYDYGYAARAYANTQ